MGTNEKKKKIKGLNISKGKIFLVIFSLLIILPLIFEFSPNKVSNDGEQGLTLINSLFNEQEDSSDYVEFFDVGQGDCTLIKSKDSAVLIDFGLESGNNNLYNDLLKRGIKDIDLAVITHNHNDHFGGFLNLAQKMKIKRLIVNNDSAEDSDAELFEKVIQLANKNETQLFSPSTDLSFKLGNATVKILGFNTSATEENNRSIIVMVEIYGKKLLFTGDSDDDIEQNLLQKISVKCDILKMGHHGSAGSSSSQFLKAANPEFAVASCGYDNLYNHPADAAVKRATELGITVLRTDLDRNIKAIFYPNKGYTIITERGAVYDSVR